MKQSFNEQKTNSPYEFFMLHLHDDDQENARGILRAFTALFEPGRFSRQDHKALLIKELNKFLANKELNELEIFTKFPFRAAGDVIAYMASLSIGNLDIRYQYAKMKHILEQNKKHFQTESIIRLRLASLGHRLTKQEDDIITQMNENELLFFFHAKNMEVILN